MKCRCSHTIADAAAEEGVPVEEHRHAITRDMESCIESIQQILARYGLPLCVPHSERASEEQGVGFRLRVEDGRWQPDGYPILALYWVLPREAKEEPEEERTRGRVRPRYSVAADAIAQAATEILTLHGYDVRPGDPGLCNPAMALGKRVIDVHLC